MRILIVINSLHIGGAERVAANMASHYATTGHEVAVATFSNTPDFFKLPPTVKRVGIEKEPRNAGLRTLKRISFIRRVVRDFKPDVTIGIMLEASTLLGISRLGLRGKYIGTEHSYPPFYNIGAVRTTARAWAYGALDAVVSLTEVTAQWHREHTHAKISVAIPNALPWPLPQTTPVVNVSDFKKSGQKLVLGVGRLCHVKGFDRMIEAFAKIASENPDWVCVILGDGDKRQELESQIQRLGLGNKVKLAGRAGNLSDWYSAADLCVSSSRVEGFPNVLVEAMSHGVPCIAFDCKTGPSEIITHGVNGELVPEGNINGLSASMSRMMTDYARRAACGKAALEVRNRYSEGAIYTLWDNLFAMLNQAKAS